MDLMPARVSGGRLRLPMTDIDLPEGHQGLAGAERSLTVGLQPEHLMCAGEDSPGAFASRAKVVDWLGAELFLHFDVEASRAEARGQGAPGDHPGARPTGGAGNAPRAALRVVARPDNAAEVAAGESLGLAVDPAGLLLFDPEDGACLPPRQATADG